MQARRELVMQSGRVGRELKLWQGLRIWPSCREAGVREGTHRRRVLYRGRHGCGGSIEWAKRLIHLSRWSRERLEEVCLLTGKRLSVRQVVPRRRQEGSHEGRLSGVQKRSWESRRTIVRRPQDWDPPWQCCELEENPDTWIHSSFVLEQTPVRWVPCA